MAHPLNVSRFVVGLATISLLVQIIASVIIIPNINQPLQLEYILLALILEFLAFAVLAPFARNFYARERVTLSYGRAFALLLSSEGFTHLIPFGDFLVQRYYFSRHKLPQSAPLRYITVLYSFGLLNLVLLFLVCQILVFWLYPNKVDTGIAGKFAYIPLFITGLLVILFLLRRSKRLTKRLQSIFKKYLGSNLASPFKVLNLNRHTLVPSLILVSPLLYTYLLEGAAYIACLKAFSVEPPILLGFYAYTFVKIFRFLPIFPGGIGEIEATSVLLFASYGFPAAPVAAASILFRFVSYWLPVAMGALSIKPILRPA